MLKDPEITLQTVLGLVAVHSMVMGLVLIIQPPLLMDVSGFGGDYEHFFPAQGGVFHLLMSVAYLTGAANIEKYRYFIVFAIFVKAVATLFLLMYCFTAEFKWIVLLSGIADFAMGLMIFSAFIQYLKSKNGTGLCVKK